VLAAQRHALHRLRNDYEQARNDPATLVEVVEAKRKAIEDELARILDDDSGITGPSDLGAVLTELKEAFQETYRNVSVTIEGIAGTAVAVGRVLVWAMLEELLANAAEALMEFGGGEIEVEVASAGDEVLVHIRDGADGVQADIRHKIFRDGTSTRGGNRGFGLYHARRIANQVNGSLELAAAKTTDPQLGGAHFLLSLPRQ
jgi:C4-dicarboxylate-specific signal transduction histidine kinase